MDYEITHFPDRKRFEIKLEDETAFVEYRLTNGSLDIIHTVVPPPIEGRGVAAALVKHAYDFAMDSCLKPLATCSYAVAWLKRHPSYTQ